MLLTTTGQASLMLGSELAENEDCPVVASAKTDFPLRLPLNVSPKYLAGHFGQQRFLVVGIDRSARFPSSGGERVVF